MSKELLEDYIRQGNNSAISDLLDSNPALVLLKTSQQISPLLLACYYKQHEIANTLLKYIAEPDLFESAAIGKFDSLASHLYKNPGMINSYAEDGFTPLGLACYFGHEDSARLLLLKGADVNIPAMNESHVYPLHSAVAARNADITKILLEAGADVNVLQRNGLSPLHSAAYNGDIELIILLLEAGANVRAKTDDGKTPADMAYSKGHTDIARILVE